ncbi:fluoride efflux transporter CrcB [soil metagenome]
MFDLGDGRVPLFSYKQSGLMFFNILIIGLGGMAGTVARFLTVIMVARAVPSTFPLGTFVVNVIGCFVMGIVFGLASRFEWLNPEWRFFLATGFCGGFTTFSAFAYENLTLIENRDYITFALNTVLSVGVCLAAVFLGLLVTRS